MKWKTAKIGDVCQIISGTTPSTSIAEYWDGDLNWIAPAEINDNSKFISKTQRTITQKAVREVSMRLLPRGTVLLSSRAPIGKVAITDAEMYCNQGFKNLVCSDVVHNEFLFWFLKGKTNYLNHIGRGATFKEISKEIVASIEIPLPPLEEQRRIAAILDKADAIRRKRKEALGLADTFLKSVFLDMFGDPVTNPKGWPVEPLGNLLSEIISGWSPQCANRPEEEGDWFVLKLSAVTQCQYKEMERKPLPKNLNVRQKLLVQEGDVLFTRKNTYDLVAACALVHDTDGKSMLSDLIFNLKIKNQNVLTPEFLWAIMTHSGKRKEIQHLASGAAASMPNISKSSLNNVAIPLPPEPLQKHFSSIYKNIQAQKTKGAPNKTAGNDLFVSLSQRAFLGDI